MRFLKVLYDGRGYGRVLTEARPTGGSSIRLEDADAWQLAQLYCDVAGEAQKHLHYDRRWLARWVMSYGVMQFGERSFCRMAAKCWVWQRPEPKEAAAVRINKSPGAVAGGHFFKFNPSRHQSAVGAAAPLALWSAGPSPGR